MTVGDVVVLKSGGPKMTVREVGQDDDGPYAICEWFDSDKKPQTRSFVQETLKQWVRPSGY